MSTLPAVVSVRLPSAVVVALRSRAVRVGRPLSDVVRDVLAEHLTPPAPAASVPCTANLVWDDLPSTVKVSPVGGVIWDHQAPTP